MAIAAKWERATHARDGSGRERCASDAKRCARAKRRLGSLGPEPRAPRVQPLAPPWRMDVSWTRKAVLIAWIRRLDARLAEMAKANGDEMLWLYANKTEGPAEQVRKLLDVARGPLELYTLQ